MTILHCRESNICICTIIRLSFLKSNELRYRIIKAHAVVLPPYSVYSITQLLETFYITNMSMCLTLPRIMNNDEIIKNLVRKTMYASPNSKCYCLYRIIYVWLHDSLLSVVWYDPRVILVCSFNKLINKNIKFSLLLFWVFQIHKFNCYYIWKYLMIYSNRE